MIINKNEKYLRFCVGYLVTWIIGVILFWFIPPGNELAYSVIFFFFIQPVAIFITTALIAFFSWSGWISWYISIVLGVFYTMSDYVTFKIANNLVNGVINAPDWNMLFKGTLIAFFGFLFGKGLKIIINILKNIDDKT